MKRIVFIFFILLGTAPLVSSADSSFSANIKSAVQNEKAKQTISPGKLTPQEKSQLKKTLQEVYAKQQAKMQEMDKIFEKGFPYDIETKIEVFKMDKASTLYLPERIRPFLEKIGGKFQEDISEEEQESWIRFFAKSESAWNWFLVQNEKERQVLLQSYPDDLNDQNDSNDQKIFPNRPTLADYQQIFRDKKYIFLWEATYHGDEDQILEYLKILKAVRTADDKNHKARILLASEGISPVKSFVKEDLWNTTPPPLFHFAGDSISTDLLNVDNYDWITPFTDRLGIDILALDTDIVAFDDTGIELKIGDVALPISTTSVGGFASIVPENLRQSLDTFVERAITFFSISYWGVAQRNRQWANHIQAIAPFYDVIVVWAGVGHYSLADLILSEQDKNQAIQFFSAKTTPDPKLEAEYTQSYSIGNGFSMPSVQENKGTNPEGDSIMCYTSASSSLGDVIFVDLSCPETK